MRNCYVIFLIIMLTACVKQPDGRHHRAPYRGPNSYIVKGRVYKTMTVAAGYRQKGTASWYGKKWHNRGTSSGERYNMYALTAAHRTLPLHSYVKVTNLKNGRSVVVRINDRGPFHSNRLIDLSYAAARRIGIFPAGMAQVDIQSIPHPTSQRTRKA